MAAWMKALSVRSDGGGEPAPEAHICRCQHAERLAEGSAGKEMIRQVQRRKLAVKGVAMIYA